MRGSHLTNLSRQQRVQQTTRPRGIISHSRHRNHRVRSPGLQGENVLTQTRNLHWKLCDCSSLLRSVQGQKVIHRHNKVRFSLLSTSGRVITGWKAGRDQITNSYQQKWPSHLHQLFPLASSVTHISSGKGTRLQVEFGIIRRCLRSRAIPCTVI